MALSFLNRKDKRESAIRFYAKSSRRMRNSVDSVWLTILRIVDKPNTEPPMESHESQEKCLEKIPWEREFTLRSVP
jgi:hypothetical protein